MPDFIDLKGVRVHNLKDISLKIPKNKLVVITGLSGSGKSSLAFDTIYAEGQRRYAESLSSYARQFMDVRDKPDVDAISGLSPTIAIGQKVSTQNPRSTVGTTTEIYDYFRLLFARVGERLCLKCGAPVVSYTTGEIMEQARKIFRNSKKISILSPLVTDAEVDHKTLIEKVEQSGFDTVRINGKLIKINELLNFHFSPRERYRVELLVGVYEDEKKQNLIKLMDTALDLSNGLVYIDDGKKTHVFSTFGLCPKCGSTMPELDMRHFSFNSPLGACSRCTGLGTTMEVDPSLVIPNPRLTLSEGAIQPWTRITGNQSQYQKLLAAVALQKNFSINTPLNELPESAVKILLYGTGEEIYLVGNKKTTFPGVIEDLKDRHLTTNSDYIRREIENYMREQLCPACSGKRLRPEALSVKFHGINIAELSEMNIEDTLVFLKKIYTPTGKKADKQDVAGTIIKEIISRLENLEKVGLGYLSLDRQMNTLSGGEVTRVRLSTQLTSGLTGVVYILDEPSVGLHPRDNGRLIDTLKYLRDMGNSVIVVEHDAAIMKAADHIIDVGPGAGVYGGEIVAQGTLAEIKKNKKSVTGEYLSGAAKVGQYLERGEKEPKKKREEKKEITISGAKANNLKNVNVSLPLGKLVCVTGVSGGGKSSLIVDILGKALSKHFFRAKDEPGEHKKITGLKNIDKVIAIDQTPIGRTPRSNPATYTGVFTLIRDLFASLPEAKMRRYDAGKFSFNVKGGGRCEACGGEGYVRIPMQFLADVFVLCNDCNGTRYNQEALDIHYKGKNIAEVLKMTIEEAYRFFADQMQIANKLNVLRDVGLGYLELGQPATMLSGGEAQRIKLAAELSRASTGQTLYILDEPTTGLHFEDVSRLLQVLTQLVDKGNSVIVIEHNTELIENSDWVIELGPEGGKRGGYLIAEGTPEKIAKNKKSWTGKYLS